INCIPLNWEKFLTFSIGRGLRFIDSIQFMNKSLNKLTKNLPPEKFKLTKSICMKEGDTNRKFELITKKGIFPYDYITSTEVLKQTTLPKMEEFYNRLNDKHITTEKYQRAQDIWNEFNCKTLEDYLKVYLVADVTLLGDVFEYFRETCIKDYGLDPAHYLSAPGFAWDCALKMTGVKLELFTQIDMHLFIEKGMRGGICNITKRFSKANNKNMQDYNPNENSTYIRYLDANNLYGWAMSKKLPTHGFKFLTEEEIKKVTADLLANSLDTSKYGYIFEVDLGYPEKLHQAHNDYPLAPESKKVGSVYKLVPN